jgi:hypothetical protein
LQITTSLNKSAVFKDASHNTLTNLTSAITFSRTDGTNDLAAVFGWNNGGLGLAGREGIVFATGGANLYTFTSERLRITPNGGISFGETGTAFGSSGQILQSNGDAPPSWVAASGIGAGSASQVQTSQRTTNASHFLTFVDSNNASATAETVYTTSSFVINPNTNSVGIGTTNPLAPLSVHSANRVFDAYGNINVFTTNASTTDMGGSIAFGGENAQGTTPYVFGKIQGGKESGGTWNGYLALGTTRTNSAVIEAIRIDSLGNVGIGTTSPSHRLSVSGSNTGSSPLVRFTATGSGTFQRGVQLFNTGMVAGDSIMYSVGTADSSRQMGQFYFHYVGANSTSNRLSLGLHSVDDVLNILGSSNVMIGTTTDNGGKLGVNGEIRASNEITAYYSSDIRLKENITPIGDPIAKLNKIRGVYFDWTDEHIQKRGGEDNYFVRKHDIGVIAQEVEAVLPELVADRDDGTKVVKYEKLVALLIEAVKDQQRQINQISQALQNLAVK